jgi:DnaJ-class molecular chaperone
MTNKRYLASRNMREGKYAGTRFGKDKRASSIDCDSCSGHGAIDERIGGFAESNPEAKCPDCDGFGYLIIRDSL